jgi:hypothetical protein
VDDIDLIHIGDSNTTPQNVFDGMQNMLNHWEGGLRATGGALVPKKRYWWYGIDFRWDPVNCTWHYKTMEELPGQLRLNNHQQEWETLTRLEVTNAQETLSVFARIDGNQAAQTAKLDDKIEQ